MKLVLFLVLACGSLMVSSAVGLLMGLAFALIIGNPYSKQVGQYTSLLLGISIIGLGANINLQVVAQAGLKGLGYTAFTIAFTFIIGQLIGKLLRVNSIISILITVGTAICGGSAIAAVTPVLRARPSEVSVALATVFILNAGALFLFPPLGHYFGLDQQQFGLWAALAIHDTSSVVGAGLQYGAEALQVATTTKLARALWIFPVALAVGFFYKTSAETKAKKPWFILGFILMSALVTWVPVFQVPGEYISSIAKRLLVLTLFLIGSNLTKETLRDVGLKPFVQGLLLWLIVLVSTLSLIRLEIIQL